MLVASNLITGGDGLSVTSHSAEPGGDLVPCTLILARGSILGQGVPPCSPPSRTLRAAYGGGLRPSLTAAARGVTGLAVGLTAISDRARALL
jgi:hypothetical protein